MKQFPLLFLILIILSSCQEDPEVVYRKQRAHWVDSTYTQLNLDQKIGQLFMLGLTSNDHDSIVQKVIDDVKKYEVGGLAFLVGTPERQVAITNEIQSNAKIPLLIALDAEWGAAMRFKDEEGFPWPMAMGALTDNSLVEKAGYMIGEELRRTGVHMNFAPVADININPNNPIIGNRSFGSHLQNVTEKASAYARGLKAASVLSCAKHFPGHGDTDMDSHKTLPQLTFNRQRLDSIELYPYKSGLLSQVDAVMVAHLDIPSLTEEAGVPASLSSKVVNGMLKTDLGYEGLIITDALNMKGVTLIADEGDAELEAFKAGNDILLVPVDVEKGVQKIKEAYKDSVITEDRLAHSVKKILSSKYDMGLNKPFEKLQIDSIRRYYNSNPNTLLRYLILENAITYVSNTKKYEPIKAGAKTALVHLGDTPGYRFRHEVMSNGAIYFENNQLTEENLKDFDVIVVGYHKNDASPYKSYKFTAEELEILKQLTSMGKEVYLNVFTSPYALKDIDFIDDFKAILVGYMNDDFVQLKMLEVLSGTLDPKGSLPISLPNLELSKNNL